MAIALSNALPVTASDGQTGRNNGRDIRKGLLSSLLLPDTKANPLAVRNGVLSHDYDTNGVKSLRVDQTGTASGQVIIQSGAFVSERAGQGPYIGWLETSAGVLLTPPGSDSTNPRVDAVFAQVLDKASISLDPSTDAIVDVVQGVASAQPVNPAVTADGAVILAYIYRPAGSTTITAANITDYRRSSGLVGTVRRLLPGDQLSDAGKVDGEMRYRQAVGSLPSLVDYWDGAQGLWRGTQGFALSFAFPGVLGTGNFLHFGGNGPSLDIHTVNVPDPGWPYRVAASAAFLARPTLTGTGNSGSVNVYANVNNGPFCGSLINTVSQFADFQYFHQVYITPVGATIFTGNATVKVRADNFSNADYVECATDARNLLTLQITPA